MDNPDVSFIVCTRSRPRQLLRAIGSISRTIEACPELRSEIVIVENGSQPDLRLDAEEVQSVSRPAECRLLWLDGGGLSVARNAAMAAARGQLLVFTDDDCTVSVPYLSELWKHVQSEGRDAIFGGSVIVPDPDDQHFTMKDAVEPQVFDRSSHPGGFVQGCNFAMTRDVSLRIGPFDRRFGAGTSMRAGEDTDYLIRAHGLGIPILYFPDMRVNHHHGRKTREEVQRLHRDYSFANGALYAKHLAGHPWLMWHFYYAARNAAKEQLGGAFFDGNHELSWASVLKQNLAGAMAFAVNRGRKRQ
ncbi:glycosyltransferase family 2 protein [Tropicimonas sediminicola]|uniref:Glycosyltransferase, GT2 family n=1 Tax=Tropicimonas sediminicola TaxID=1031541 RepID=A0A239CDB2_9RHOB|nr:glycosyltransferase [Tropicimonas sediminicola]SNS17631.1 Glycosyltransferase, GT2 family [Tropicimonas sediminicola]